MMMAWVEDEARNTKEGGKEHWEKGRRGETALQSVAKSVEKN